MIALKDRIILENIALKLEDEVAQLSPSIDGRNISMHIAIALREYIDKYVQNNTVLQS